MVDEKMIDKRSDPTTSKEKLKCDGVVRILWREDVVMTYFRGGLRSTSSFHKLPPLSLPGTVAGSGQTDENRTGRPPGRRIASVLNRVASVR
jgi:hypothetical protein